MTVIAFVQSLILGICARVVLKEVNKAKSTQTHSVFRHWIVMDLEFLKAVIVSVTYYMRVVNVKSVLMIHLPIQTVQVIITMMLPLHLL